ncbi:MAG: RNA polymerase sigma factor [Coprococcus sp.]
MVSDFDDIYKQYGKTVYFFLLSLSKDESLSEELTQETMFRAIMNINSFRGDSKISSWLCQIAKNLYFEWRKKSKRTLALDENTDNCDSERDISIEVTDKDTADRILQHLHELDEPYKEVFTLHALGDVPLKRISELFGKSDSWSRVTYYRAKAIIISKLEEGKNYEKK